MPTKHVELTTTDEVSIVKPPEHRKVVVKMIEAYNVGTADVKITLRQVSPDGSVSKPLAVIPLAQSSSHINNNSMIYDLDRGFELKAVADAASDVHITITYVLE